MEKCAAQLETMFSTIIDVLGGVCFTIILRKVCLTRLAGLLLVSYLITFLYDVMWRNMKLGKLLTFSVKSEFHTKYRKSLE